MKLGSLPVELRTRVSRQAETLRQDQGASFQSAFDILDEVAAYQPGSGTSRLAQIALKAGQDGDSNLAQMGGVQLLEQFGNMAALAPALQVLTGPLGAVLLSTFDTLTGSSPDRDFIQSVAETGLRALESEQNAGNPLSGPLAAEPFLLGLAEHEDWDATAGSVGNFLQEEMPATFGPSAAAAYRSVLETLAGDQERSPSTLLARAGAAILHSLPGQEKAIVPMCSPFLDEIGSTDNPFIAVIANEAGDQVEAYAKKEETVSQAVALADAAFAALSGAGPTSVEGAYQLGSGWLGKLSGTDVPAADRLELGESYFRSVAEEIGSPMLEFARGWVERVPEDSRLELMQRILETKPDAQPGALLELAGGVAGDRPAVRDGMLGGLLAMLAEETGQSELSELSAEPFSPEGLQRKEKALAEFQQQMAEQG